MSRNKTGLKDVLTEITQLKNEFWQNVKIPRNQATINKNLEFAGRVADFLELGQLMAQDALNREESCGAHFREEYQTSEGEAQRNDTDYCYVAAWEYSGDTARANLHQEKLDFENVSLTQRSYK